MLPRFRFAPSPTGRIHVGNLRTALFNWLSAAGQKGVFLLRFDDTDAERSRPAHAEGIVEDLRWAGIEPDEVFRQSERLAHYDAAAERLRQAGRLYPCFETPEELEAKRRRQRRRGLPPVYDRAALDLSAEQRQRLLDEGRRPHWRFLLTADPAAAAGSVTWDDRFRGEQAIDLASLSDPVLIREDGTYLYTLPSVVDDIERGISDVIRGEDHVTNTAVQIVLFEALGADPPRFGHHNLLTAAGGEGLSKRTGSRTVAALREEGYEPMAVATLASLIGTSAAIEPVHSMAELAERFVAVTVSRAPARFDEAELANLNARLLHETGYDEVADRLAALGVGGGEAFWLAVRANCGRLADAADWWRVVTGPVEPAELPQSGSLLDAAIEHLPPEPWDRDTFSAWTGALKQATGAKGKALFQPLRLALTGRDHGPELAALLPLIGRSNTLARLAASRPH